MIEHISQKLAGQRSLDTGFHRYGWGRRGIGFQLEFILSEASVVE